MCKYIFIGFEGKAPSGFPEENFETIDKHDGKVIGWE
jgi:hypothetical protein